MLGEGDQAHAADGRPDRGVLLLRMRYGWRPGPVWLGGLVHFALFFYPAAADHAGHRGSWFTCSEELTSGRWSKQDGLAGAAQALSTLKPQMGYLFVPFVLLWGLRARRWRMVCWFAGVWGGLICIVYRPARLAGRVVCQLGNYTSSHGDRLAVWVLFGSTCPPGRAGRVDHHAGLVAGMLLAWVRVIHRGAWTSSAGQPSDPDRDGTGRRRTATPHSWSHDPLVFTCKSWSRPAGDVGHGLAGWRWACC
jgi:hypothetical protein